MAFLVRCPKCAAPKRIDPTRAWEPELTECPRCASAYEACAGHGFFTLSERGPWTRYVGASPTMQWWMEEQQRLRSHDLLIDAEGDLIECRFRFESLVGYSRGLFGIDLVA